MINADVAATVVQARLCDALGAERVITDPDLLADVARDQLRRARAHIAPASVPAHPLAAVRPTTTAEVAATLRVATALGVPVVQYGGGTGLMGGALHVTPAIVLDLRSLQRITVDAADRTVTAQAGAVLADVGAALEPHGLILGHDPWTVPIATVGGALSTNSLGYRGAKYGGISDQALGLEVVLADGTVVRTRPVPRSSTGPRLLRLFAGAEGTLGVITEATLRAFPAPERRVLIALDVPGFAAGYQFVLDCFAIDLIPAMIDYGAPLSGTGRMVLAFEGFSELVAAQVARARPLWRAAGASELPAAVAQEFWDERHVSPEWLRRRRREEGDEPRPGEPGGVVFDFLHMALPASQVLPFATRAQAIFERHGCTVREWGLWNQPELLSTAITRVAETPADLAEARAATDAVLMLAQDLGGSMEYVHGVGVRYAHLAARELGAGLDVLRAIKRALDPDGLLNPGKLGL